VDIYSLAMVMWEMLHGTTPWHDLPDTQILAAVREWLLLLATRNDTSKSHLMVNSRSAC
jgi:hypothetical protein